MAIKIYRDSWIMPAVTDIQTNGLPRLREVPFDKNLPNLGLLPQEEIGFAYMTGDRHLPCLMKDGYHRNKKEEAVPTIVLENDLLRATFLPNVGGRLWSLYHKGENREILFCNPVLQPGNLANCNAWVSGGIEWNLGQFGHSSYTMSPVYFASCTAPDGRKFLRMYDYERIKGLFFQIDFHLFDGDDHLYAHVTITNPHKNPRSLYWWTNTAVELNRHCRVLSGTREVVATTPIETVNHFGHDCLPNLKAVPEKDGTYPEIFPFSSEYFYQNEGVLSQCWEMAAYSDNTAYFDRSTTALRYRKMFCWSNAQSGDHWQHFLATDDAPLYVELQAGVCPSQVHGEDLAGETSLSFTQAFGTLNLDCNQAQDTDLDSAIAYGYSCIEASLSAHQLTRRDLCCQGLVDAPVDEILNYGSGFALLEEGLTPNLIPTSTPYFRDEISAGFAKLASEGKVPPLVDGVAPCYLTDSQWLPHLKSATQQGTPDAGFYYGIALFENGFFDDAQSVMADYAEASNQPIAHRTLGYMKWRLGDLAAAKTAYQGALVAGKLPSADYYEEYIRFLCLLEEYETAWRLYADADEEVQGDERVCLRVLAAAVHCRQHDFLETMFSREFSNIREGEVVLNDLWEEHQRLLLVEQGLDEATAARQAAALDIPYLLDFRLS